MEPSSSDEQQPEPVLTVPAVDAAAEDSPSAESTAADPDDESTPPKRRRGGRVAIILLSVVLALVVGGLAYAIVQIDSLTSRINEQDRKIDEQEELIEKKETFGAAMAELMNTAAKFDGLRMGELLPSALIQSQAEIGWKHRWDAEALDRDTGAVESRIADLEATLSAAAAEASTNVSGTSYEAAIDSLGSGFVVSALDNPDALCESDVLGCVMGDDPYTVHFDANDLNRPFMTDFIDTGLAYHEFAHVLQMTNPKETKVALEAFGGDSETMADCFALTYLPGWTLDHTVWTSDVEYWEVSIGYGYTCNEGQRQAIRDWHDQLAISVEPVTQ